MNFIFFFFVYFILFYFATPCKAIGTTTETIVVSSATKICHPPAISHRQPCVEVPHISIPISETVDKNFATFVSTAQAVCH